MSQTRRLAAILAADVAGYSRLMGEDEEGTLASLKAIRRELADPKIKEHRGRIVKTTGDGLLLEFASVVDAVRCAVEVQPMTLGNPAAARVRLIVWCKACGHRAEPDPAEIAQRYGADTTVLDWRERLVCSACGSRNIDMVVTGTERGYR